MSIRAELPIHMRRELAARDLRHVTQTEGEKWRAQRPVYRVHRKHEVKPLMTRFEMAVIGIGCIAVIVPWVVGAFTIAGWFA